MADLIIKGVNIPNKRTIELMRAELACVSRCECNRCCEDCDLVQDVDELIAAFRATIRILEAVANAIPLPKGHGRLGRMFRKLIHRIRKRRFCKANHWFCPDCIYHEHLFDGFVYRGVRCHYPTEGGQDNGD